MILQVPVGTLGHDHQFARADGNLGLGRERIVSRVHVPGTLDGRERAVLLHADPRMNAGADPQREVGHVLLFREHDLYGTPGCPAQEDRVGLDLPAHDLRAEPAAALRRDGSYLHLPVEDVEEGHLVQIRRLGGPPDGHLVRVLPRVATAPTDSGGRAFGYILVSESAFGDDVRLGRNPSPHRPAPHL